jgi:hypothetical protein
MAEKQVPADAGARRIIGRVLGIGIIAAAAIMVVVTLVQVGDKTANRRCNGAR